MHRFPLLLIALLLPAAVFAQPLGLTSPDGRIEARLTTSPAIGLTVLLGGEPLARIDGIALETLEQGRLGGSARIRSQRRTSHDEWIETVVPNKNRRIRDRFNELLVTLSGNLSLRLRAYDSGIAYRLETGLGDSLTVIDESLTLRSPGMEVLWFPEEESFFSHNEREFKRFTPDSLRQGRFCSLPLVGGREGGPKFLFSESNLRDYPGLWLEADETGALQGIFPNVPRRERLRGDRDLIVLEREPFIARTKGSRTFPWRFMGIAEQDQDLLSNELSYLLADPLDIEDPSWIRPGKVAWDWYNFLNLTGVDFRAGVNTATYTYFIDFAAENGLEYVILDEGWYRLGDVLDIVPAIDLPAIVRHAATKDVGIILWVVWTTLDDKLDEALAAFETWGIKGIKVDFMQRDDQPTVNWYREVTRKAAAHHLLVDFHGAYKPDGLRRAYPNLITREGVRGLEHNKWANTITPTHNVTLPFTRMAVGPMDYTPGAVRNAHAADFGIVFNRPMSLGTRSHQVAMYVVYESPLQMLSDSPTNYLKAPESLEFMAAVPTVWDETVPLAGRIGQFVAVARRSGERWFVGAMTNEEPRTLTLPTAYLEPGTRYEMEVHRDGPNADRNAEDFVRETVEITGGEDIPIELAGGGGWAARIVPAP